jgi:protein-S-isoprenylcysteine O-methyltransferase Ste14
LTGTAQDPRDHPGVIALPPLLYAAGLGVVLVLRWLRPGPVASYPAVLWPGIGLVVLGAAIGAWGRRTMKAAGTNVNPSLPTTSIVTTGPFRYSRNPLYVALALLFLGLGLALNTWWGPIVLGPLLVVMHWGVIAREERYLERKFGDDYLRYKSRVRRYL